MRRLSSIFLFLFLLVISVPSRAQTLDTSILGVITDSSGAVIPGASVTVSSTATGIAKKAVTAATGEYSVTYLAPGTYNVEASANGFDTIEQKGIVLEINQQARINLSLRPGAATQIIEVEATQPLLQSEDASLGVVIGQEQTEALPLNGRKYDDLATLTPGVIANDADAHTGFGGSTISAYGSQVTWGQFNLDGVTEVNNRSPYINILPSIDAIQEFKVFAGNMEAEYGGSAGTITNVQIKSGTNAFHGDVFDFFRNTAMDARNYFRTVGLAKQVLKQNQFGATLGGPIVKDRTFFFMSYEGLRSIEQSPSLSNVLTPAQENGDFSALSTQLKNTVTGVPYVKNQIPVNPVSQSIAKNYMPLPNTTQNGQNYSGLTNANETQDQYLARIDHKFNDANQLAVHFLYEYRNFPQTAVNPNFAYTGTYPMFNAALQYLHTFSPVMVNELRLGYDFEHVKKLSIRTNTNFTAASLGINGFVQPNGTPWPPNEQGFPIINISGLIGIGDSSAASNIDDSRTYQLIDNFTWTRGKHSLIFGYEVRHLQDNATTNNQPFGQFTFASTFTGNASADFMLGYYQSLITPEGVPLTFARQWRDNAYAQDNWKITPKLTLNLGLRWDLWVPPHNNLNTSRTLSFASASPVLVSLPTPLWQVSHKNFGPRVGFAYLLPHQTVLRSAFSVTWYGGKFDNINILQLNPPSDPSYTLTNGTTAANPPLGTLNNPIAPGLLAGSPNIASLPPDGKHPNLYLQTWNLTLSKQFWSNVVDVSYVGVKGTHQDTSLIQFNVGPPQASPARLTVNQNRPYPNFGQIRMVDFHGASMYNGLNIHLEHRFSHGLNFTTAYSWSHLLDNQQGDTNTGNRNGSQSIAKNWATGVTDQRNALTIAMVYQLPKYSYKYAAERAVLNGWGFNSIFMAVAGLPIFITQSADGQNNGNNYEFPDVVPGQSLTLSKRTPSAWFNTNAFATAVGHYGNMRRNPVTGAPQIPLTLAVNRSFPTFEGQHLDFRIEAFNALNEPQWGIPGASQGSSTFGKMTSTSIDNRELQLALKYNF
jgi:Carboxypeptidase regulatory-like domain